MEIQLDQLLDKIKKEGIEAAEEKAATIIAEAEKKAADMLRVAQGKIKQERRKNRRIMARREEVSKSALVQSSRDIVLRLEEQLKRILEQLTVEVVKFTYKEEVVEVAIQSAISSWNPSRGELILSESQGKKVLDSVKGKLKDKLASGGVSIVLSDKLKSGFILSEKDGSAYYDFSAEAIASVISQYGDAFIKEIISRSFSL